MSKNDELIRMQLQKRFKSPVGIRDNEETLYANIARSPLMRELVTQIEVLQIEDAIKNNINYKRLEDKKIITQKRITLYLVDKQIIFNLNEDNKAFYNGNYYSIEELYEEFGITKNECTAYIVEDGTYLSWYDPIEKLYFDAINKIWTDDIKPIKQIYYLIDKPLDLEFNDDGKAYYKDDYYTQEELYESFGITTYPTEIYSVKDGDILSWYDKKKKLYFDAQKNIWTNKIPKDQNEWEILPNPTPLILIPSDISEPFTWAGTKNFTLHKELPHWNQGEYLQVIQDDSTEPIIIYQLPTP